ncbi:MAG: DNA cytosine methyltransferase [Lutibacter sp.]|jgi:DNA (cytosine-5)-methyltransferase 1
MLKPKYKVLDLFAGAGGFGLGFQLSDNQYELVCSLEKDAWAVETLNANNSEKHLIIQKDIRHFNSFDQILSACPFKPDIIIGGPPCQGFSIAGPNKDPKDPRNSLFKNFAQWVDVFKPKVSVMENVSGLLSRKNENGESVIDIITDTFKNIGYKVIVWKLNAANYGVPQNRERIFIVGSKYDQVISPPPITHFIQNDIKKLNGNIKSLKPAITVIDAIGDLPKLNSNEGQEISAYNTNPISEFQKVIRENNNILYNHVTMAHTKRIVERYKKILNGYSMEEIPVELMVRKRNGNGDISKSKYHSNYRHLKPEMVSFTIPASFYSNFIHPNQPRNITSREAARLQTFPDRYIFKGKRTQISSKLLKQLGKEDENFLSQYNQIGNAVPPLLAKAVAKRIHEYLIEFEKT